MRNAKRGLRRLPDLKILRPGTSNVVAGTISHSDASIWDLGSLNLGTWSLSVRDSRCLPEGRLNK